VRVEGENALRTQGQTQAEAWHRACQQAEALGMLGRTESRRDGPDSRHSRVLAALDRALEGTATALFGPRESKEAPPSLAAKLCAFGLLLALVLLGLAARGCW
jgi:hypothetical protein